MCRGASFRPAVTSKFSTASAPCSSRKYAISAKLSSTLAGMTFLQFLFLFCVRRPFFREGLVAGFPLYDSAPLPDQGGGDRLQEDTFRGGLHDCFGAVLNIKSFSQPCGD